MVNNRRKLTIIAGIAASFVSCTFEGTESSRHTVSPNDGLVSLVVRLAGINSAGTRAVELPGTATAKTIELNNGHIFVVDTNDNIIRNEPLNISEATAAGGQLLGEGKDENRVPANSRVFILGNIPPGTGNVTVPASLVDANSTLSEINTFASPISNQTDYKTAVLTNSSGVPASIKVDGTTASVTVSIKPVISRLELVSMRGDTDMQAFTVNGVYLDSYYPEFTFGAGYAGTPVNYNQSTAFPSTFSDAGTWPASRISGTGPFISSPADNKVWAYNVAAGHTPRLLVRLNDIKYEFAGTTHDLGTANRYITVVNYTALGSSTATTFERGHIYRIKEIEFDWRKLSETPNPINFNLSVAVEIDEWEITSTGVKLD